VPEVFRERLAQLGGAPAEPEGAARSRTAGEAVAPDEGRDAMLRAVRAAVPQMEPRVTEQLDEAAAKFESGLDAGDLGLVGEAIGIIEGLRTVLTASQVRAPREWFDRQVAAMWSDPRLQDLAAKQPLIARRALADKLATEVEAGPVTDRSEGGIDAALTKLSLALRSRATEEAARKATPAAEIEAQVRDLVDQLGLDPATVTAAELRAQAHAAETEGALFQRVREPSPDLTPEQLRALPVDDPHWVRARDNQRFLAAPDGSPDIGFAPRLEGTAPTAENLPVRLRRSDIHHLDEPLHRDDAQELGYRDGLHLALDVARNWTHLHEGRDGRMMLVRRNGTNAVAVVEIRKADGADYWRIVTAGVRGSEQLGKELGARTRTPGTASGQQPSWPAGAGSAGSAPPYASSPRVTDGTEPAGGQENPQPGPGTPGRRLEQRTPEGPKGSITFLPDGRTLIQLFEGADLSTVLHEAAHLFLEVFADVAGREGAPAEIRADWQTLLDWMGVKSRAEIGTPEHEKFARGFEAYLMEGKAPSIELQSVFDRFRAWLTRIYRSLKGLGADVTPEVRRVFDRMLATDQAIREAEAASARPSGRRRRRKPAPSWPRRWAKGRSTGRPASSPTARSTARPRPSRSGA
jgi:hypothetical protein